MDKDEIINWFKLVDVKGLGPKKIIKLLNIFSDINELFLASQDDLLKTKILKPDMVTEWIQLKDSPPEKYEKIIVQCHEYNIKIIPLYQKEYPIPLKLLPDTPLTLFTKGNLNLLDTKKIAIVGSRKSDANAKLWAFKKSQEFVKKGITIVSGGAEGIDFEAHSGALEVDGNTICVLGSGFFNFYPFEHENLFNEISKRGLLLSEYPPDFRGGRVSLLARNRITSGISDAILVVTTTNSGGSMTQLKIAHQQGIPIFCPKLELGFTPIFGIKEAVEKYNVKEIEDIGSVLDEINKPKPTFLQEKL
ncbi:MAG: DNA-processing protein DprA [Candidatus Altiarchaeota archaeon]